MRNIPKLTDESYYLMTKLAVLLVQRYNELVEENVEEAHAAFIIGRLFQWLRRSNSAFK